MSEERYGRNHERETAHFDAITRNQEAEEAQEAEDSVHETYMNHQQKTDI